MVYADGAPEHRAGMSRRLKRFCFFAAGMALIGACSGSVATGSGDAGSTIPISVRGSPDGGESSVDGPVAGLGGATGEGGAAGTGGQRNGGIGGMAGVAHDAAADQTIERGSMPDASVDVRAMDGGGIDAPADLLTGGDAAPDANGPIDRPPVVCSAPSTRAATLTVVNNYASITVTPYWINGNCQEQPYPEVGPGLSLAVGSFVGHAWRIRRTSDHVLLVDVPPLARDTTVTVP
jgi:hypothetical protein